MIAIITYNELLGEKTPITLSENNKEVLLLPCTFRRENKIPIKSPDYVLARDTHWQTLIEYKDDLDQVIIFAGKKSSGALEIITLAHTTFGEQRALLHFVLCNHDLKAKKDLLTKYGYGPLKYTLFSDGLPQCDESVVLLGFAAKYLWTP